MVNFFVKILKLWIIIFCVGSGFIMANDKPVKVLEKKNIIVYDLNSSQSNNHFKAIYYIDTDLEHFKNLVLNPENHKNWIKSIKSAENINNISDTIIYTYIIISVKSILKKEAIVKTIVEKDPDKAQTFITQQIDTSFVYDSKYKRLKNFIARWEIREVNKHRIEVRLSFQGNKKDYPDFIDRYLRSIFIKKLYRIALRSRKQALKAN